MGSVANALAAGYHCNVWWLSLVCQVVISVLSGGYQMVISGLLHDLQHFVRSPSSYPSFINVPYRTTSLLFVGYQSVISGLSGGYPSFLNVNYRTTLLSLGYLTAIW